MGNANIDKLRNQKSVEQHMDAAATRKRGSVKLGDTADVYLYADSEEVRAKSNDLGLLFSEAKGTIQPGQALSFSVPFQVVDFLRMSFHPAADQPSSAVFPHSTLTPSIVDPNINMLYGFYSVLTNMVNTFR